MRLNENTLIELRELINEVTIYRGGRDLVNFFNRLGFNDSYGPGFPSRWIYTDEKLSLINDTADMDLCIKNLFHPGGFIGKRDKLLEHIQSFNEYLLYDGWQVVLNRDQIVFRRATDNDWDLDTPLDESNEIDFLNKIYPEIDFQRLGIESQLIGILERRFEEAKICIQFKLPISTIFLTGSILEGVLLSLAVRNPKVFNLSKSSPKDNKGKVKPITSWKLSELINTAKEIGFIDDDIKKFSHALRDYRNYIHPYQQLSENFIPSIHTAEICLQVLNAACSQIIDFEQNKKISS